MKSKTKKKKRLANHLAITVAISLMLVFALFIGSTYFVIMFSVKKSITEELKAVSKANGTQIQEYYNTAERVSLFIKEYVSNEFIKVSKDSKTFSVGSFSEIFPKLELDDRNLKIENFILENAEGAVGNSIIISSVIVAFEPYAFSEEIESYSIEVKEANGEVIVEDFGKYSEYGQNEFYQNALQKEEIYFTPPYNLDGIRTVTASQPMFNGDKPLGVIYVNLTMDTFKTLETNSLNHKSAYACILAPDGTIAYHSSDMALLDSNMGDYITEKNYTSYMSSKEQAKAFHLEVMYNKEKMHQFYYPILAGNDVWFTMTSITDKDVLVSANNSAVVMCVIEYSALVIIVAAVLITLRRLLRPIGDMASVAKSISKGRLDLSVNVDYGGEIGELAAAFQNTIEYLKLMIEDITKGLSEIADNNFAVASDLEYIGDFAAIDSAFKKILDNLNHVMTDIKISSDHVSGGAEQLAVTSQSLAEGTANQASSVEELFALINEVNDQVDKNAVKSKDAASRSSEMGMEVENTNSRMKGMVNAMSEIAATSKQIEQITKTIEDIASQTNLLSLNAAIEAARAGDAGKGFAVVADEIRKLAGQSAEAARNTRELIGNSIRAVENGSAAADTMELSLQNLVVKFNDVVTVINGINKTAVKQAQSMKQVSNGVEQISDVVESNSAVAEESAATSEELSAQAQASEELIKRFQLLKQ